MASTLHKYEVLSDLLDSYPADCIMLLPGGISIILLDNNNRPFMTDGLQTSRTKEKEANILVELKTSNDLIRLIIPQGHRLICI